MRSELRCQEKNVSFCLNVVNNLFVRCLDVNHSYILESQDYILPWHSSLSGSC